MVTNKLAVKMMFYPLRFRGLGRVGWHGIVPSKALPMANDIVDNVMLRLINVSQVFTRLPPEAIAAALDGAVLRVGSEVASEIATHPQGRRQAWAPLLEALVRDERFNATLLAHSRPLVAAVVRDLHREAERVFDLRSLVVRGMTKDSRTLVRLFERCGERDLRFVVRSGLIFGGMLGLLQMLLWRVWSPWWSLALTGGLVGYVTDLLAIRMLFEPVDPVRLGPLRLHGLFLKRQSQVSDDFAAFMQREVLAAPMLWEELMGGARQAHFWDLVSTRVELYLAQLAASPSAGAVELVLATMGEANRRRLGALLAARLQAELPKAAHALYELTDDALQLEQLMQEKMRTLSSSEFERVLHPVFEEDELTLILIGTGLGGIAGFAQAAAGI